MLDGYATFLFVRLVDGWMDGCCVNKGGKGVRGRVERLPRNAIQVSTAFGKTQGCVVLVAGFVGCLAGYQCKASIDSIWGTRFVAWFVCRWWATHPFFFTLGSLVGASVGSACLAGWLLGFGENTYSDGWIMDRGKKCNFLARCRDCLRDTVLDG